MFRFQSGNESTSLCYMASAASIERLVEKPITYVSVGPARERPAITAVPNALPPAYGPELPCGLCCRMSGVE
jgi:hypothetical protein